MQDQDRLAAVGWVLCLETQRCIWTGSDDLPEVDIAVADQLTGRGSRDLTMVALNDYLLQIGGHATWADVRPIEECAICGQDFDTQEWHKVLALSLERGAEDCPTILEIEYAARICPKCAPCR